MSSDPPETSSPREPWPYVLAGMLLSMIAVSLAFLAVAILNPDPEVPRHPIERSFANELSIPAPDTARQPSEHTP